MRSSDLRPFSCKYYIYHVKLGMTKAGIGNWKVVAGKIVKGIEPVVEVFHSLEFE